MGRDAYRVSAGPRQSPAGSPPIAPASGREPQRVGLGQELTYASLVALSDGSLFLLDSFNKQALRIQGRKKTAFKVFSTKWSYINAAAAAPDGSIWFYDQLMKGIRIYTLEGHAGGLPAAACRPRQPDLSHLDDGGSRRQLHPPLPGRS